jgi:TetR/AcrR family acrAB operon transcriptional repressor
MARRTKEEALATREQLLDAAERVFRLRGVGHTSLAEVADAAGVTRGAIYWHFKNKAELFEAMTRRAEMPMDTALDDMEALAREDPLKAIEEVTARALRHLAESPRTQAVFDIAFHRCEYTDELADVLRHHREQRVECIARCEASFALAVERGSLPPDTDVGVAAHGLYALASGLMRDWVQAPEAYDLPRVGSALVATYLNGLRAGRAAKPATAKVQPSAPKLPAPRVNGGKRGAERAPKKVAAKRTAARPSGSNAAKSRLPRNVRALVAK